MTPSESRSLFGWAIDLEYMAKQIRDVNAGLADNFCNSAAILRALADQKIDPAANKLWCERCGSMWTTHNTEAHDLLTTEKTPQWVFKDLRFPHPVDGVYVTVKMTEVDALESARLQNCAVVGYIVPTVAAPEIAKATVLPAAVESRHGDPERKI